jgi:hypothetical protein
MDLMEMLDRGIAQTGKQARLLGRGLKAAEEGRKDKRAALVAGHLMYCKKCGNVGPTKRIMKGSFVMEVVLWFLLLLPGLIYSVWRLTTKGRGCPVCGSEDVIPADSPLANNNANRL